VGFLKAFVFERILQGGCTRVTKKLSEMRENYKEGVQGMVRKGARVSANKRRKAQAQTHMKNKNKYEEVA